MLRSLAAEWSATGDRFLFPPAQQALANGTCSPLVPYALTCHMPHSITPEVCLGYDRKACTACISCGRMSPDLPRRLTVHQGVSSLSHRFTSIRCPPRSRTCIGNHAAG